MPRLTRLSDALDSDRYADLAGFVRIDSDGLQNPLPNEVCANLALAVAYASNDIPEYDKRLLEQRAKARRERRSDRQRLLRAAKRHNAHIPVIVSRESVHITALKSSTIHLAAAATAVQVWTRKRHYREQTEMLRIMGLFKGDDFIRDRLDSLSQRNPVVLDKIELWAAGIRERPTESARK